MEKVNIKVDGMSCTNCALTIHKYLEKQGLSNVKVNFIGGDVSFETPEQKSKNDIEKGIEGLGYHVVHDEKPKKKKLFKNHFQRFIFCLVFTLPLMLHMLGLHIHFLMNPYVQLALTIPVFIVGMDFFGRSAWQSVTKGVPNMNVLIAIGAIASFGYSLYGTLTGQAADFMFYETTATILTLVFLGNWLEDKSVETTQRSLRSLATSQKVIANLIMYENGEEKVAQTEGDRLKTGDIILVRNGEQVPADCTILWGEASANEAIITGESVPVDKKINDKLIGGSVLTNGTVKAHVTAAGEGTVLNNILKMVKEAQAEKPPVQQMADKISAIFVPVVLSIAAVTFLANYFLTDIGLGGSLLRSIAVLVIACPCAMGLATPAAIAVGLGRAAKNGVLFKNAKSLEVFKDIQQAVFDKTGTLTTGRFAISAYKIYNPDETDDATFKRIVYSLEKYSLHPIAKAVADAWKTNEAIKWQTIKETKGLGIQASDKDGNIFTAGSFKSLKTTSNEATHNIYIQKNDVLIGWIDVQDDIRPEAKQVINYLHSKNIKTILLSGDKKEKSAAVAQQLGIDEVIAEQSPEEKLNTIARLTQQQPTVMIGDGINDAPALAKATVGISLSEATQVAMQSAQVVLMNYGLKNLPLALGLGRHTYITIKQNLFWAFLYNIIAIPVAAFGLLTPTFGALIMGLSDVVLAINSVRLNYKKVI